MKQLHYDIIQDINKGKTNVEICNQRNVEKHVVFYVKRKYKDRLNAVQVRNNAGDLSKYEEDLTRNLKLASLTLSDILAQKSWKNMSAPQLTTAIGTIIDKLRLIEGKSTANVAHQVLHALDEDDKKILRDAMSDLKHAFLKK